MSGGNTGGKCMFILDLLTSSMCSVEGSSVYFINKLACFLFTINSNFHTNTEVQERILLSLIPSIMVINERLNLVISRGPLLQELLFWQYTKHLFRLIGQLKISSANPWDSPWQWCWFWSLSVSSGLSFQVDAIARENKMFP